MFVLTVPGLASLAARELAAVDGDRRGDYWARTAALMCCS